MWRDLISGSEVGLTQVKVSKRFAALRNLNDSEDINRAWESIKQNIKISGKQNLCLY
jgi:hypothetical protein